MSDEKQAEMTSEITPESDADTAHEGESAVVTEAISQEAEEISRLREEVTAAKAKADEYWDKLQRSAAEFQNSRRRLENQQADEIERANGALIKRFMPVLDDFDLAFQNVPSELQGGETGDVSAQQVAWVQGFRQIRKKLLDIMADQGVTTIDTSGAFDPHLHEAISSEPNDSVESGHIISEVRAGYMHKGRVLRPALVRIAS